MPGLDGLRGIAILAVLLHHFVPGNYPVGIPAGLHGVIIKVVYRLCDVGWWGVDLFFVLSGFLITGILIDAKGADHFFRNFYARRSLRIFPLYYAMLFVLFAVLPALAATRAFHGWLEHSEMFVLSRELASKQIWLWLYGTNIKTAIDATGWTFGYFTYLWSLSVEEHFYLIWPFVVFLCDVRTLGRVCLLVAAGSLVMRVVFLCAGMAPAYIFVLTPCRVDGLGLGGLVAVLSRGPEGLEALLPMAMRVLKIVGPIALLTLLTLNRFGTFMTTCGYALLAGAFAASLPMVALAGIPGTGSVLAGRVLLNPVLRAFGKYSYGIYVLHVFVVDPIDKFLATAAMRRLVGWSYELHAATRSSLAVLCAFILAYLSWNLFEKHFLKLKVLFPSGRAIRQSQVAVPVETDAAIELVPLEGPDAPPAPQAQA